MSAKVVVGVDGSPPSDAALRWAADEAAGRGATLEIVHAWNMPYVGDVAGMAISVCDPDDVIASAQHVLDAAVKAATRTDGPQITAKLAHGDAARALLDAAAEADLLVVGSRGRGGFAGLLLGSVSQQCTHHAPCPIVVVPHRDLP